MTESEPKKQFHEPRSLRITLSQRNHPHPNASIGRAFSSNIRLDCGCRDSGYVIATVRSLFNKWQGDPMEVSLQAAQQQLMPPKNPPK